MKYGKKRTAYAITLDYDRKHEILLGHIYETKGEVIEVYKKTGLYKPNYKICKIQIKEV